MIAAQRQRPGGEPPARAADLLAEFHARHAAWQREAQEVARLRAALRTSAGRDAALIVAAAHANIRGILDATRRNLTLLTAQLDAVASRPDDVSHPAPISSPSPSRSVPVTIDPTPTSSFLPPRLPLAARKSIADAHAPFESVAPAAAQSPILQRRSQRLWIAAAVLIGAVVCAGGAWRLFAGSALGTPRIAAAAPVVALPAVPSEPNAISPPVSGPSPPSLPAAPLSLTIEARGNAWIRSTADNGAAKSRLIKAGEILQVAANREIAIVVGDAGAVALSLNGGEATTPGRRGQVFTRRFTVADVPESSAGRNPAVEAVPLIRPDAASSTKAGPQPPAQDSARAEIVAASERWLDAYYRHDRARLATMTIPNVGLLDERRAPQRLPEGLAVVRRTLDRLQFEQRGETAILGGRITERSLAGAEVLQHGFVISQNWVRRANQWRLAGVRITPDEE